MDGDTTDDENNGFDKVIMLNTTAKKRKLATTERQQRLEMVDFEEETDDEFDKAAQTMKNVMMAKPLKYPSQVAVEVAKKSRWVNNPAYFHWRHQVTNWKEQVATALHDQKKHNLEKSALREKHDKEMQTLEKQDKLFRSKVKDAEAT